MVINFRVKKANWVFWSNYWLWEMNSQFKVINQMKSSPRLLGKKLTEPLTRVALVFATFHPYFWLGFLKSL